MAKRIVLITVTKPVLIAVVGSCSLLILKTESDFTSVFGNAAMAKMFACKLSVLCGLNPDEPRDLHKVTITR